MSVGTSLRVGDAVRAAVIEARFAFYFRLVDGMLQFTSEDEVAVMSIICYAVALNEKLFSRPATAGAEVREGPIQGRAEASTTGTTCAPADVRDRGGRPAAVNGEASAREVTSRNGAPSALPLSCSRTLSKWDFSVAARSTNELLWRLVPFLYLALIQLCDETVQPRRRHPRTAQLPAAAASLPTFRAFRSWSGDPAAWCSAATAVRRNGSVASALVRFVGRELEGDGSAGAAAKSTGCGLGALHGAGAGLPAREAPRGLSSASFESSTGALPRNGWHLTGTGSAVAAGSGAVNSFDRDLRQISRLDPPRECDLESLSDTAVSLDENDINGIGFNGPEFSGSLETVVAAAAAVENGSVGDLLGPCTGHTERESAPLFGAMVETSHHHRDSSYCGLNDPLSVRAAGQPIVVIFPDASPATCILLSLLNPMTDFPSYIFERCPGPVDDAENAHPTVSGVKASLPGLEEMMLAAGDFGRKYPRLDKLQGAFHAEVGALLDIFKFNIHVSETQWNSTTQNLLARCPQTIQRYVAGVFSRAASARPESPPVE